MENRLPEPENRFQNSNLAQAWLVLVMALFFGATLAAVQINLSGVISKNKLSETLDRIPELVWGASAGGKMTAENKAVEILPGSVTIKTGVKTDTYSLFKVTHQQKLAGWVIKASGQGYADKIELLIGVDPEVKTLTGLFILEQKETPGLGNKITFPEWRRQFVNKQTAPPLVVVKGGPATGNTIDAITGATISSRSVTAIVNRVMAAIKGKLTPDAVRLSERRK